MAGVRKAGEDFFWNSEGDDKQKCSDTVLSGVWAPEEDRPGFKHRRCHGHAGCPRARPFSLSISRPVDTNAGQHMVLTGLWRGSGDSLDVTALRDLKWHGRVGSVF